MRRTRTARRWRTRLQSRLPRTRTSTSAGDGSARQQYGLLVAGRTCSRTTRRSSYIPWQLPPKAQTFGQAAAAPGQAGDRLIGLGRPVRPGSVQAELVYVVVVPRICTSHRQGDLGGLSAAGPRGGPIEPFGPPSYVAAQVVADAIDKACLNGNATRAEVLRKRRSGRACRPFSACTLKSTADRGHSRREVRHLPDHERHVPSGSVG